MSHPPEAPAQVLELAAARAQARAAKDFAAADRARERIAELGWTVVDEPGGSWRLEPQAAAEQVRLRPQDVASVLQEPSAFDLTLQWVVEGWPQDIDRSISSFRGALGSRKVQFVVADITGEDPGRWGDQVEVLSLQEGTGWGAARNAGLNRSLGQIVVVLDGSIEASGDIASPLEGSLADPGVGVCGPFGIVTPDLQRFDEAPADGDVDAIEGYLMAVRRQTLIDVGLFDEKFKWYRTADIELSFRIKDSGLRAVQIPVPVIKHEHRMWFETDPAVRAKWSKRNYYRFLEKFRGRYDLCVNPER
jgi:glycosyltransferase involved in cell wall biosynthesis